MCTTAVCYYRVSTTKQGVSGLGIEAQKESAANYCKQHGLDIIDEFEEVQSGGKNDREMIAAALRKCKLTHSRLVVAKLDRISRDIGFIDELQKSGIKFVCADMPEANDTMIQFMSVFAQYERKMASDRTKAALAAKKEQGVKLGSPQLDKARQAIPADTLERANAARSQKAIEWSSDVLQEIEIAAAEGCTSFKQIADWLNSKGIKTRRGKEYSPTAVKRVVDRHKNIA